MEKVILVIDDEKNIRATLEDILSDEGYKIVTSGSAEEALKLIKRNPPDLVLLDIWLPGLDGIQTLKLIKAINPDIEVIMMSGHGAIDIAVQATKNGAVDFIEKPFSMEQLSGAIERALNPVVKENIYFAKRKALLDSYAKIRLAGSSKIAKRTKEKIDKISKEIGHTLLIGENGLGKRYAARYIKQNSDRNDQPFVEIWLSDLSDNEFHSTFNATKEDNIFIKAKGGLLFLENIDALKHKLQDQLAEILKPYFDPTTKFYSDIKIIGSTTSISKKIIRASLIELFNKNKQLIKFVPLRRRPADITEFVEIFAAIHAESYSKNLVKIDSAVFETLSKLPWHSNVKGLSAKVEQAIQSLTGKILTLEHFDLSDESKQGVALGEDSLGKVRARSVKSKSKKILQKTLKRSIVLCGQGLHSGINTGLILSPQPPNSGILFTDISTGVKIAASIENVESTQYATTLASGSVKVKTVEHILSALSSYQITNLLIKIGDEAPIRDGSAIDFCNLIEDAGVENSYEPIEPLRLSKTVTVGSIDNPPVLIAKPSDKFSVLYKLDYPLPLGKQEYYYEYRSPKYYKENIASARTFGFLKDLKALNDAGLATGGKLSNVVLIDDEKIVNTELRFPDEPARHKILDLIGDLYLLGRPVLAEFTAIKSGHTQNIEMVKKLSEIFAKSGSS
ncbi:MAG: UDP-3-O-acyl-N-acetylglucosamine deacetylase [Nitrospinota bacterium]